MICVSPSTLDPLEFSDCAVEVSRLASKGENNASDNCAIGYRCFST
jgi:hypothetical protein